MDLLSWIATHSQTELIKRINAVTAVTGRPGISRGRVSQIVAAVEAGYAQAIPAERCRDIFLATNGECGMDEMRPDLFAPVNPWHFYSMISRPPMVMIEGKKDHRGISTRGATRHG